LGSAEEKFTQAWNNLRVSEKLVNYPFKVLIVVNLVSQQKSSH